MSFVIYLYLILLINNQTLEVTVAYENFWELNGPSASNLAFQETRATDNVQISEKGWHGLIIG